MRGDRGLRFGRQSGEVRRDKHIVALRQPVGLTWRLLNPHIERRPAKVAGLERSEERILIHHLASRGVDDERAPGRRASVLAESKPRVESLSGTCTVTIRERP